MILYELVDIQPNRILFATSSCRFMGSLKALDRTALAPMTSSTSPWPPSWWGQVTVPTTPARTAGGCKPAGINGGRSMTSPWEPLQAGRQNLSHPRARPCSGEPSRVGPVSCSQSLPLAPVPQHPWPAPFHASAGQEDVLPGPAAALYPSADDFGIAFSETDSRVLCLETILLEWQLPLYLTAV